jgi:hypothetical protein
MIGAVLGRLSSPRFAALGQDELTAGTSGP